MSSDEIARFAYLGLMGAAIVGWFLLQNRRNLGTLAQQMAVWGLIFIGVIAGLGLWSDIRQRTMLQQSYSAAGDTIRVPVSRDGHYYLTLRVNNVPVRFAVDTGASQVVLTRRDARRVGFDPTRLAYVNEASTANGVVKSAPVRLRDVQLGTINFRNLRAEVNAGQMQDSLLGMSYLRRFQTLSISRGILTLKR